MYSTTMSALCQTCSSTVPLSTATKDRGTYRTPCCAQPICQRCITSNPRLAEYDPCLRCGDLVSASGIQRVERGAERRERQKAQREEVFRIDDSDEDEGEDEDDGPPAYDSVIGSHGSGQDEESALDRRSGKPTHVQDKPNVETQVVKVCHPVSRNDTILSISRRYAADPHEILRLNDLPPSVLSSQPHLLRTRKTILISQRTIAKTSAPDRTLFNLDDVDSTDPADPTGPSKATCTARKDETDSIKDKDEAERRAKRERERAVKRFQLMTKSVDPGVGRAYLSLSELEEQALEDLSALELDSEIVKGGGGKSKLVLPEASNREQRALDAFYNDETWAATSSGPSQSTRGAWQRVGDGQQMGIKI